jgi:hypothetical protein
MASAWACADWRAASAACSASALVASSFIMFCWRTSCRSASFNCAWRSASCAF